MKKWILLLALCLLLTGCAQAPEPTTAPDPTETTAEPVILTVYVPEDDADGFFTRQVEVEAISEAAILAALTDAGVLTRDVEVNVLELVTTSDAPESALLHVDFNAAFAALFQGQGTAGEYVLLGSVVNTFLTAYDAQTMRLTVEGAPLETGHNVYEDVLEFYSY